MISPVKTDHKSEVGQLVANGENLLQLALGRAEDRPGLGVFEQVAHLVGQQRRIDRDADDARRHHREVGHGPLPAVLGDQGALVALPQARLGQGSVQLDATPLQLS